MKQLFKVIAVDETGLARLSPKDFQGPGQALTATALDDKGMVQHSAVGGLILLLNAGVSMAVGEYYWLNLTPATATDERNVRKEWEATHA